VRSKTDKTAKQKAPTAKPSATTDAPKKRGRPRKVDVEAAQAAGGVKPVKKEKAPKVKLSEKKANAAWQASFSKIETLAQMGAVHIKVDGIEVVFPPDAFQAVSTKGREFGQAQASANEYQFNGTDEEMEASVAQLAKVAPMDNPDEYAEAQDRWANHEPMPRI
jgi:hypothetical protein